MITHDHERLDFSHVPHSKGIKLPAFIVLAVGLVGIFMMGGLSIGMSSYGHMWQKGGTSKMTMRMCLEDKTKCPAGTLPQK